MNRKDLTTVLFLRDFHENKLIPFIQVKFLLSPPAQLP